MQSKVVKTLTWAVLMCGTGIVLAQQQAPQQGQPQQGQNQGQPQQPGQPREAGDRWDRKSKGKQAAPEKSKLEEMLTEALKNNPDIRVATAKLAEAEAKLNRARVEVTQKVVALHHAILAQQEVVVLAQKKYDLMKERGRAAVIPQLEVDQANADLTMAKAKLEELQVQLPALLGKVQKSASAQTAEPPHYRFSLEYEMDGRHDFFEKPDIKNPQTYRWTTSNAWEFELAKVKVPQADKLRKALQTPIKVDFKDITFDEILQNLSKKVEGLSFRNLFQRRSDGFQENKYSLRFEEALPVSAILQALSDETGCLFFVREYGIVATTHQGAPKGAMTVETFLRQPPADPEKPSDSKPQGATNRQQGGVEGKITEVDGGERVRIDLGVKDGVNAGDTVEVYRLGSKPTYLGTLTIVQSLARSALAKPKDRPTSPIQVGDRVRSKNSRPLIQFQSRSEDEASP